MSRFNRRTFLKMSIGAGQLALLGSAGATMFNSKAAWARAHNGPTKLMTIYVPGGWMPYFFMPPLSGTEITDFIPERRPAVANWDKEPAYFNPEDVTNIDGSGDAMDEQDAQFQRLRVTKFWDKAKVQAGEFDADENLSLNGYAWDHYDLWKKSLIVHGVDQGTADHRSGLISALSGAAGANWRSPAVHAWVANALHKTYGEERILGAVGVGGAPVPVALGLLQGSATKMSKLADLTYNFSQREDLPWEGIRGDRMPRITQDIKGNPLNPALQATRLEADAIQRIEQFAKRQKNARDTAMLEQLWQSYGAVSKQLASDIVTKLESTEGWRTNLPKPTWQTDGRFQHLWVTTGKTYLGSSDHWKGDFDLGLRLLKSGLASSISIEASGAGDQYLDHHGSSHAVTCVQARAVFEAIGRLLGEMDTTPGVDDPSKTLLDETMVMVLSEFSRTWPKSGKNDHHPATSVIFAGGGIQPNRMIGGYDTSVVKQNSVGPMGKEVAMTSKSGDKSTRAPRSGDIVHTALVGLGIEEFELPGGSDLIDGVLA